MWGGEEYRNHCLYFQEFLLHPEKCFVVHCGHKWVLKGDKAIGRIPVSNSIVHHVV